MLSHAGFTCLPASAYMLTRFAAIVNGRRPVQSFGESME
jgi:hypothetical protein